MIGFPVSASGKPHPAEPGETLLVCVPNWIGDSIMSMPALHALQQTRPDLRIVLLAKRGVAPLWTLYGIKRNPILLTETFRGLREAAKRARAEDFSRAYVMPHSFRSALVPFLAGIPLRIGTAGRLRSVLLTHVRTGRPETRRRHQAWEYLELFDLAERAASPVPAPRLHIPRHARLRADALLEDLPVPRWGLMPGAARGPSKRWPIESFRELARKLTAHRGGSVVVMGSANERDLCQSVADAAGPTGRNLAGQTDLTGWAALLQSCAVVVANDSGGMHMASALGIPVVALFGATDPKKTGPLGTRFVVLQAKGVRASRDIARNDASAEQALSSITPERVLAAGQSLLYSSARTGSSQPLYTPETTV